jgi:hypothetical protein
MITSVLPKPIYLPRTVLLAFAGADLISPFVAGEPSNTNFKAEIQVARRLDYRNLGQFRPLRFLR